MSGLVEKKIEDRLSHNEAHCISTTISGSDIKRLDSCVDVFSEAGDATGFGEHRSEDSFIIEVR